MARDIFLDIPEVPGESEDSQYKGKIDIHSWTWSAHQSGSMHQGGGGGSSKATFADLGVSMPRSKASSKILEHMSKGTHIPKATLFVRKAGGKQEVYTTIIMEDLIFSSYTTGGSGGDELGSDNLSISFAKVSYEYKPQMADGSLGTAVVFNYDIKGNVQV